MDWCALSLSLNDVYLNVDVQPDLDLVRSGFDTAGRGAAFTQSIRKAW